jgi:hypothetical protein
MEIGLELLTDALLPFLRTGPMYDSFHSLGKYCADGYNKSLKEKIRMKR